MKCALFILIFIFLGFAPTYASIELSADFSYNKQVFGDDRQNSSIERLYKGSIATYLFQYTALELNFSISEEVTTVEETIAVTGTTASITGYQNNVENTVYGIGIRQALAGKDSFIRPLISIGYAKQFIKSYTDYRFFDSTSGQAILVTTDLEKSRQESVFGTFTLQIRLSGRLAIRGSVNTVFPAFDFNKAKDSLKYLVGFTLIF